MEYVKLSELSHHPRNYRGHPESQLAHIMESIRENGVYRNIVVSSDNVVLAGHGVLEACRKLGIEDIPINRLPFHSESPKALKVLTGDNEISRLGEIDDNTLAELLKDIDLDDHLLGTGFDEDMLLSLSIAENIVQSEDVSEFTPKLPDEDQDMSPKEKDLILIVKFEDEDQQQELFDELNGRGFKVKI